MTPAELVSVTLAARVVLVINGKVCARMQFIQVHVEGEFGDWSHRDFVRTGSLWVDVFCDVSH